MSCIMGNITFTLKHNLPTLMLYCQKQITCYTLHNQPEPASCKSVSWTVLLSCLIIVLFFFFFNVLYSSNMTFLLLGNLESLQSLRTRGVGRCCRCHFTLYIKGILHIRRDSCLFIEVSSFGACCLQNLTTLYHLRNKLQLGSKIFAQCSPHGSP